MRTVSPSPRCRESGGELAGDEGLIGGLPRPVAAHNAHPVVPGDVVGEVPEDHMVPEGLGHVVQLHRLPAQAAGEGWPSPQPRRSPGPPGLSVPRTGRCGPCFWSAGPGPPHDPLVLHPEDGLALALGGLLHLLLLGFQFQVLGIVGLVVADAAVGELGDPVAPPAPKSTGRG